MTEIKISKNLRLKIDFDQDTESPREWDNFGTMVCFHKRYALGDKTDIKSEDFGSWNEMEAYLRKEKDAIVVLPLYLYDHSGLRMKVGTFQGLLPQGHAEFDSGQVGFIYVTKAKIEEEFGKVNKQSINKAGEELYGEVETYDDYLSGQIYFFVLEKRKSCDKCGNEEWEVIESVGGFYDKKDIVGYIPKKYQKKVMEAI